MMGAWWMLLWAGCAVEDIREARLDVSVEPSISCGDDSACVVSHNTCEPVAWCSHLDEVPGTPDVVCDPPRYLTPPDEACVCGASSLCEPE